MYWSLSFQSLSICSNDLPFVSGNILYTTKKATRQKKAKNQNVPALPMFFNNIGVSCPTMVSATHITMMLMANALPRMAFGKISDATTNFKGPIEKAKQARKPSTHTSNQMLDVAP